VGDLKTDAWSRGLVALTVGMLAIWGAWALIYETTGVPGLNYLSFGLISLPIGAILAILSVVGLARTVQTGGSKHRALTALLLSLAVGLVPWIALLTFCDGCVS
jgi:hypothetical protein